MKFYAVSAQCEATNLGSRLRCQREAGWPDVHGRKVCGVHRAALKRRIRLAFKRLATRTGTVTEWATWKARHVDDGVPDGNHARQTVRETSHDSPVVHQHGSRDSVRPHSVTAPHLLRITFCPIPPTMN